jgi:hypothetical protein
MTSRSKEIGLSEYDPAIGAKKALAGAGTALAALAPVIVPAIINYLGTDANVEQALRAIDPRFLGLAPIIAALVRFLANYRKQVR